MVILHVHPQQPFFTHHSEEESKRITHNSEEEFERTLCFKITVLQEHMQGGLGTTLLANDKFVVLQLFKRVYVLSFAEKARTAGSWQARESRLEDEDGKLMLWEYPRPWSLGD